MITLDETCTLSEKKVLGLNLYSIIISTKEGRYCIGFKYENEVIQWKDSILNVVQNIKNRLECIKKMLKDERKDNLNNVLTNDYIGFVKEEDSKILEVIELWKSCYLENNSDDFDCVIGVNMNYKEVILKIDNHLNKMIAKTVDFFWQAGAGQLELDSMSNFLAIVQPQKFSTFLLLSSKGGIDGGWLISETISYEYLSQIEGAHEPKELIGRWVEKYSISKDVFIGRDMSVAPQNHFEVIFSLPGSCKNQITIALESFEFFGFPPLEPEIVNILQTYVTVGLQLNLVICDKGFIKISIIVPNISIEHLKKLCNIMASSIEDFDDFLRVMQCSSCSISHVEYQYLHPKYSFGVYDSGFNVYTHFSIN